VRRKRYLAARVFFEGEIKAHYFREEVKDREKMETEEGIFSKEGKQREVKSKSVECGGSDTWLREFSSREK
jgi:hypothetical protein